MHVYVVYIRSVYSQMSIHNAISIHTLENIHTYIHTYMYIQKIKNTSILEESSLVPMYDALVEAIGVPASGHPNKQKLIFQLLVSIVR